MANRIKIDNASLKRFKQKPAKREKTKHCRILIVCEGEKTEPNYFEAFKVVNNDSYVVDLTLDGGGINTMEVVNKAISLRDSASTPYDSVWAVFDRDSFPPNKFNGAITKAKEKGINIAWSNEAFELWYLFHFHNRITAMPREDYKKAISDAVNNSPRWKKKTKYKYAKNDPKNYAIMNTYGNLNLAITWAENQHKTFDNECFANHNPCTTVYKLVNQLLNKDKNLINEVMDKINSEKDRL